MKTYETSSVAEQASFVTVTEYVPVVVTVICEPVVPVLHSYVAPGFPACKTTEDVSQSVLSFPKSTIGNGLIVTSTCAVVVQLSLETTTIYVPDVARLMVCVVSSVDHKNSAPVFPASKVTGVPSQTVWFVPKSTIGRGFTATTALSVLIVLQTPVISQ